MKTTVADFGNLYGTIDERILDAALRASNALSDIGVRHALIGGLAVGAYGYVRATRDIDFLLHDEGFEHRSSGILTLKAGVPIESNGVRVDTLSEPDVNVESASTFVWPGGRMIPIPVLHLGPLVFLKLKAYRRRDQEDVVELLRCGVNAAEILEYLESKGNVLSLERFETLMDRAGEDE
jgi:hypothetical protein